MDEKQKIAFVRHTDIPADIHVAARVPSFLLAEGASSGMRIEEHPEEKGPAHAAGRAAGAGPSQEERAYPAERVEDLARRRRLEREDGRRLITDMVHEILGAGTFRVEAAENSKPHGFYNGRPIELSISHSRRLIGGAVAERTRVGIDLEPVDRRCHPRLRSRILHREEIAMADRMETLQLWTLKEAVLKWEGSGLRMAMNCIRICRQSEERFRAWVPGGRSVEICSFVRFGHWFALAWSPDEDLSSEEGARPDGDLQAPELPPQ